VSGAIRSICAVAVRWNHGGSVGQPKNEVGSVMTVDAGAIAPLHEGRSFPSMGCGCDVSQAAAPRARVQWSP